MALFRRIGELFAVAVDTFCSGSSSVGSSGSSGTLTTRATTMLPPTAIHMFPIIFAKAVSSDSGRPSSVGISMM